MSSVLRNMKRVKLASSLFTPDNILAQVLPKPPYKNIQYAATSHSCFYLNQVEVAKGNASEMESHPDITICLTNTEQYFFVVKSLIEHRSVSRMWTRTTTANNKMKFVTLITSFNRFTARTASGLPVSKWYQHNNSPVLENSNLISIDNNRPVKNQ